MAGDAQTLAVAAAAECRGLRSAGTFACLLFNNYIMRVSECRCLAAAAEEAAASLAWAAQQRLAPQLPRRAGDGVGADQLAAWAWAWA